MMPAGRFDNDATGGNTPVTFLKLVDPAGQFGFLKASDWHEVYFHKNSVLGEAFGHLTEGSRVIFSEESGTKDRRPAR